MAFGVRLSRTVSTAAFYIYLTQQPPGFLWPHVEKLARSRRLLRIRDYLKQIKMSHTRRSRYSSRSPSPYHGSRYSRSLSRTPSRSRSRSRSYDSGDAVNPGNNLYVTGLSTHVTKAELEDHFASKGKVVDIHLVVDPYTRESRGFGFVTMARVEEAERCIKYLDGSVLDGRAITVEKAKRGRGRTPTPGRYLGLRKIHARRRSPSCSPYYRRSRYSSSSSDRERSYSPYYYRRSPPSPYRRYRRSPVRRRRYHSSLDDSSSRSRSPWVRRRKRSYSYSRSISPAYRRRYGGRRSYSRSISPRHRRSSSRRRYSSSVSPPRRRYSRSPSRGALHNNKRNSRESYSHSHSTSLSSSSLRSA